MANKLILQFLWFLMLHCRTSQAAAAAAAHVRVVRSDAVPTALEELVERLSQRLDVVEAENQALRNDVQTLQAKNAALERTVEDLQRNQQSSSGTVTAGPTAAAAQSPGVSLALLEAQVQVLQLKSQNTDRELQSLQNGTNPQALQSVLQNVDDKYQIIEQIVLEMQQDIQGIQSNVTGLQTECLKLTQQLNNVTQMATASQNVSSSLAALQTAVNSLVQNGGGQSQQNLPNSATIAFEAFAGDSTVRLAYDATMVFPRVLTNEGQAYNKDTGKATVSVEGVYLFLVSAEVQGHGATLKIVVNGHSVAAAELSSHSGPGSESSPVSLHALVRLHAGDSVWVQSSSSHHDGVELQPGQGSSFIGLLLHG